MLKSDMRKHIVETHGKDICHKFLQNNCTARRCFFSHNVMIAQNGKRSENQLTPRVPTQQDFFDLSTVRPAERRQEMAKSTSQVTTLPQMWKTDAVQDVISQAITQQMQKIFPQIIAQIKESLHQMNK